MTVFLHSIAASSQASFRISTSRSDFVTQPIHYLSCFKRTYFYSCLPKMDPAPNQSIEVAHWYTILAVQFWLGECLIVLAALGEQERGIGGYLYHVVDSNEPFDPDTPRKHPGPKAIQPILFLSCDLIDAETRYWPTELEVAGLVWMIKKVRHLVEASKLLLWQLNNIRARISTNGR